MTDRTNDPTPQDASEKHKTSALAHLEAERACRHAAAYAESPAGFARALALSAAAHRAALDALEAGSLAFHTRTDRLSLFQAHGLTLAAAAANEAASRAPSPTENPTAAADAHHAAANTASAARHAWESPR